MAAFPSYRWTGLAGPFFQRFGNVRDSRPALVSHGDVSPLQTSPYPAKLPSTRVLRHFSATGWRAGARSGRDGQTGSMRIDLNADLGEGVTDDDGLLGVVT